jgi:hypothetical protein
MEPSLPTAMQVPPGRHATDESVAVVLPAGFGVGRMDHPVPACALAGIRQIVATAVVAVRSPIFFISPSLWKAERQSATS